jgi:nicotinamide mononucleotide transporter
MLQFFDINTTLFVLMGYQMSYLEFFGTILNLLSVYLVAKNKILNWPVGIVAVVLYMFLFYQIRLYSDMMEQIYFLISGFFGWYMWSSLARKKKKEKKLPISDLTKKGIIITAGIVVAGTIALGYVMQHIHLWIPSIFTEPASFPYLDAFTTVLSFVAQFLMAKRILTSWYLWITVDVIGIWLYFVKGVKFISLEYILFLIMASWGLYTWHRIRKDEIKEKRKSGTKKTTN